MGTGDGRGVLVDSPAEVPRLRRGRDRRCRLPPRRDGSGTRSISSLYEKLMNATLPQYGNVTLTGICVWQDATYGFRRTRRICLDRNRLRDDSPGTLHHIGQIPPPKSTSEIPFRRHGGTSGSPTASPLLLATFGTVGDRRIKIKDPATGGRRSPSTTVLPSPSIHDVRDSDRFTVATIDVPGAVATATHSIGDRGYALMREGDFVNVVETDARRGTTASRDDLRSAAGR